MALSLDQIRTFVRDHLDLDTEDLSDTLLNVFIREGSKRIEKAASRWPFYETGWFMGTVANQAFYTFDSISPAIDQITSVQRDDGALQWLGFDLYQTLNPYGSTVRGKPLQYAWWGNQLYLNPTPDAAYVLVVRGYREPTDWVANGAGAVPDLPDELHNTVATWALAKAYAQQEDPELSAFYERQFNDELMEFRKRITEIPNAHPLVLNGQRMSAPAFPGRLRYPWEV